MMKLTRAHAAALAVLGGLLVACTISVGLALHALSQARDELDAKRAAFARFAALSPAGRAAATVRVGRAPRAAFIDAPTKGQAGAQLEAYLARLVREHGAALMSSGVEGERKGEAEAIRVQATVEIAPAAMQTLLYQLETGTPYLVIESLTAQPSVGAGHVGTADDAPLRLVLVLRGLWSRGTA